MSVRLHWTLKVRNLHGLSNTSTLIEISADVLISEHLDKAKRNVITYLNGKKVLKSKAGDINIMYIFGD